MSKSKDVLLTALSRFHRRAASTRRTQALAGWLAQLIPDGSRVLDVGCFDGALAKLVIDARPAVKIEGVDVLIAETRAIEVTQFDGRNLPFEAAMFDAVLIIDVLHHTRDPEPLLVEARRVLKPGGRLIIKDHYADDSAAWAILAFMDWVGNKAYGNNLPYNFLSRREWRALFDKVGLQVSTSEEHLGLYPQWARWLFERNLHFLATLSPIAVAA